jgi:hypothetical protein
MKPNVLLVVTSLVAIVLMTLHLTVDAFHTREGVYYPGTVAILGVWLYGALRLGARRSGHIVLLLGGLFGLVAPYLHLTRTNGLIGGEGVTVPFSPFFVWTLLALGTTSAVAVALAIEGLWRSRRGGAPRPPSGAE